MTLAEQLTLLQRNVEAIIPKGGLELKLAAAEKRRRPLVVKLGLDPTAPDIHLGHTVVLRKLREFQDLGHNVVLIVGDFTARIGDPSGRSQTRPALTLEQIKKNAATYKEQATKVLRTKNLKLRFNNEWLGKLKVDDFLKLMGSATVAQLLTREDFHTRYTSGQAIGLHELLYPLLQAQDSVAIKADIEIGGTDQTFNMLMGRELQERLGLEPQVVITMPLIPGLDGKQKMSKSLHNFIGIRESAESIYGKIMSIPDTLIIPYLRLLAPEHDESLPRSETEIAGSQMQWKQKLALSIASLYTSEKEGSAAQEKFSKTFQKREFPKDAQLLTLQKEENLLDLLAVTFSLFPSKSEARRKIVEGAVRVNGKKLSDPAHILRVSKGEILELQVGKLGFYRLTRQ